MVKLTLVNVLHWSPSQRELTGSFSSSTASPQTSLLTLHPQKSYGYLYQSVMSCSWTVIAKTNYCHSYASWFASTLAKAICWLREPELRIFLFCWVGAWWAAVEWFASAFGVVILRARSWRVAVFERRCGRVFVDFFLIDLEVLFCGFGELICLSQSLSLSVQLGRMLSD